MIETSKSTRNSG